MSRRLRSDPVSEAKVETNPIRVAVFGATGRMGAEVCRAVSEDDATVLVGAVDPSGGNITSAHGSAVDVVAQVDALDPDAIDVAVDFTVANAATANLEWCAKHGIHAVVGTTGFSNAQRSGFASSFTSSACLIAANFAISAVLMMRFAEQAAPFFDSVEIIELHHDNKKDAPSGTSIATAQRIADASSTWAHDPTESTVFPGARGGVGPGSIPIHAVRLRGLVAHQEVLFGTTGQSLTIRQDSYDRTSFMPGVLAAVKAIGGRTGVIDGLDTLLFD